MEKKFVRFKELNFSSPDNFDVNKVTAVKAFIPGVNSGMYQSKMCIRVSIKQRGFLSIKKMYGEISLTPSQIIELRDECNKILALSNQ